MRRPSPLPLPPAPPQQEKPAERTRPAAQVAPVAESAPTTPVVNAAAEERVAPLLSFGLTGRPDPAALTAPVESDGIEPDAASDAADAEPDVGFREVWRAARARRRALRAEVRRFTVRQRRRRALWLGVAASVVALVVVTVGAAYSPLFAVEKLTVVGTSQLDAATVESSLARLRGVPLAAVDESAVKAALVTFPLVESYSLEARPPHELVVRIVERTPIGFVQTAAGFTLVDAAGVALSTAPAAGSGYPVIDVTGGVKSPAFAAVGQVMRSLPSAIRLQVTGVHASTPDDVTLRLDGTNTDIVWGSAEESALKAKVLEEIMAQRPPASVLSYDVSSPRAVVVR